MDAANKRFDAVTHATDRVLNVFIWFGGLGSFLGGLFVALSWISSRRDYHHEREFYEKRALVLEEGEKARTLQQLELGHTMVARSGDLLSGQIDSIVSLKGVIDLVSQTFQTRLQSEKDIQDLKALVAELDRHFENQYQSARDHILTFARHSRMAWTRLSAYEKTLAETARADFRSIPGSVIQKELENDRYQLARVYQLLGVSAFYANDIDTAERYLKRAQEIYKGNAARPEDVFPRAFASYFLGLISKNWLRESRYLEDELKEARQSLEEAAQTLKDDKAGEFLIPVTLAEVLSYSPTNQQQASDLLVERITEWEKVQKSLDENQTTLLGRACLLKGNLEYLAGRWQPALTWFQKAEQYIPSSPFPRLSIAHATPRSQQQQRKNDFERGLTVLEASDGLSKPELTGRAIVLAWAVIASHELQDIEKQDKYLKKLDELQTEVRSAGGRQPLFFCPLTKTLCTFAQIRQNLSDYIK